MYEDIKANVRIGQVLSRYGIHHPDHVQYRIPCPIHGGRDANFSVSEESGLWNCFSTCGRGGSVIDLVAALDDVSISDAVKKLREDFQLTPIQASHIAAREYTSKNERFKKMVVESEVVDVPSLRLLEDGYRGLRRKTIEHWGLARTDAGVFIPLDNSRGQLCSYSIRRDDGDPKYDNKKGTSKCYPFGLYKNKADIIREGFVFLVEGQLDAIALWQFNYKNVVSLMGSSMTEQQAMLILAVTSKLVLVMDGDDAGRQATAKIKNQWSNVFDIASFDLDEGVDPDEYVMNGGQLWVGSQRV